MTQYEFQSRAGVKVTPQEFEHINEVYMMTDMDKDAFCKWWKKNCKGYIKANNLKWEKKDQEEALETALICLKSNLLRIAESGRTWYPSHLLDSEAETLSVAGINCNQNIYCLISSIEERLYA